jgi:hypothetical protein
MCLLSCLTAAHHLTSLLHKSSFLLQLGCYQYIIIKKIIIIVAVARIVISKRNIILVIVTRGPGNSVSFPGSGRKFLSSPKHPDHLCSSPSPEFDGSNGTFS